MPTDTGHFKQMYEIGGTILCKTVKDYDLSLRGPITMQNCSKDRGEQPSSFQDCQLLDIGLNNRNMKIRVDMHFG